MLGEGAWGKVLLGRFRGCKIAVKQVHNLVLSSFSRSLFEREMKIASRCRHPHLLQFIGATNDEGPPLFVTELMETSLRALLDPQLQPLSDSEISIISSDVEHSLLITYTKLSLYPSSTAISAVLTCCYGVMVGNGGAKCQIMARLIAFSK